MSSSPLPVPALPAKSLPPRFRGGDLLAFAVQTQLPVGYSLFFILTGVIGGTPTRLMIPAAGLSAAVAVDANGLAQFSVPGSVTTTWQQGRYNWLLFQVDGSANRDQLAEGQVYIEADPAGSNVPDPRTYNQQLLDAVRQVLANSVTSDISMYKIGAREVTKMPRLDLMKWEAILETRVMRERRRRGQYVPSSNIGITFGGRR